MISVPGNLYPVLRRLVEAGWLDEEEALHHEDRHIVSNMIGAPNMRIEIGSVVRLAAHWGVLTTYWSYCPWCGDSL